MSMAIHERTMPHSLEAEQAVLGAILLHDDVLGAAAEVITPAHFFRDAHRRIFSRMLALADRRSPVEFTTLTEALATAGELDDVGGRGYISSLVDGVPRSTNVAHYARVVRDKADLRGVIYAANKMLGDA